MTGLRVPRTEAENPQAGGNNLFPVGTYVFEIVTPTTEEMRLRVQTRDELPDFLTRIPDWGTEAEDALTTGDITQLTVWFQSKGAASDTNETDPGDQIFFQTFIVQDGSTPIADVNLDESNGEGRGIRRDARLWAGLQLALGAITLEEEDGKEFVVPAPNSVALHSSGAFDGKQVIAEVAHRTAKASGNDYHLITRFEALS